MVDTTGWALILDIVSWHEEPYTLEFRPAYSLDPNLALSEDCNMDNTLVVIWKNTKGEEDNLSMTYRMTYRREFLSCNWQPI